MGNFNSRPGSRPGGRPGGRFGGRPRSGGFNSGFRDSFEPRKMHKAVCSKCKKECEVPFEPTEGKPVYCKECYAQIKPRY